MGARLLLITSSSHDTLPAGSLTLMMATKCQSFLTISTGFSFLSLVYINHHQGIQERRRAKGTEYMGASLTNVVCMERVRQMGGPLCRWILPLNVRGVRYVAFLFLMDGGSFYALFNLM